MKKLIVLTSLIAAAPVRGGILDVNASITATPDSGHFDYSITLNNSAASTDSLQTFWFSWVPGKDFMNVAPLTVTPPAGWTDIVTHAGATDGYAIQFKTSTPGLAPGGSLDFQFTSDVTPAQLAGNSPFFPTIPELTSFVYQGQPFAGDSAQLTVSAVPEPTSLVLGAVGASMFGGWRVLRKRGRREK